MNIKHENIMKSRQLAGRVVRYHTWPMIRKPTVAEHQARVATLYCELWGLPRAEVLYYCLHHDNGEFNAGDTPHYAKRDLPELGEAVNRAESRGLRALNVVLPSLSTEEHGRFKMADYLEMYETAVVERNMGNKYAEAIIENLMKAIPALSSKLNSIAMINNWLKENG